MLHGWDNRRIAHELGMSKVMVKRRITSVLNATGAENRLEAVLHILSKPSALAYVMELPPL